MVLREDWPEKREEALNEIKKIIREGNETGKVIIISNRLYGSGPYKHFLKGLKFDINSKGLAPHPNLTTWLEKGIDFAIQIKFLSQNNHLPLSGIMYDFGLSSHQIDSKHRGFSFQNNSPLDMRMDMLQDLSAASIVNNYSEEKLTKVLKAYSEDRYSNKISKKIIESRPVLTTNELVKAIKEALPRQNPIFTEKTIRRIFQALRIEVNDELNEITFSLNSIKKSIKKKGIILCISYHSLEDKIVKKFFNELTTFCICEPSIPICKCDIEQQFSYLGKKKYLPTEKEKESNPRSKSAIMRYVVKL